MILVSSTVNFTSSPLSFSGSGCIADRVEATCVDSSVTSRDGAVGGISVNGASSEVEGAGGVREEWVFVE